MKDGKTWLNCKEAAKILGYTQRHILNLIKNGKLSAQRDESGQYFIDKSEFYRVYPEKNKVEASGSISKIIEENSKKLLEERIKHLEEILTEKTKINEFLTEQLLSVNQEKSKMLEAITSYSRLLEHKEYPNIQKKKSRKWWFK